MVTFWEDLWSDQILAQQFPALFSSARDRGASVNEIMNAEDLDNIFFLPISEEAYAELQGLNDFLQLQHFDDHAKDVWSYQWGSITYSSSKFYKTVFQNIPAHPAFSWVWKSKCTPRVKFFAWLIVVDRLNTKTMLRRRHMKVQDEEIFCVLCNERAEEDLDDLFFNCPFARRCWEKIGIQWNTHLSMFSRLAHTRQQQNVPFFMEAVIIAAWEIWKIRNDKIFKNGRVQLGTWFSNFRNQCLLQSLRFSDDLRSSFCVWLDAFS